MQTLDAALRAALAGHLPRYHRAFFRSLVKKHRQSGVAKFFCPKGSMDAVGCTKKQSIIYMILPVKLKNSRLADPTAFICVHQCHLTASYLVG
jgi:hypothetical protein